MSLSSVYRDIGEHESALGLDAGSEHFMRLEAVLLGVIIRFTEVLDIVTEREVTRSETN